MKKIEVKKCFKIRGSSRDFFIDIVATFFVVVLCWNRWPVMR